MPPKSRPLTAARRVLEVLRRLGYEEDVVELVPALLPEDLKPSPSSVKTYLDVLVRAGLAEKTVRYERKLKNNVAVYKVCQSKLREFIRVEERRLVEEWARRAAEKRPKTIRIPADTAMGEYISKLREEVYSLRKAVKRQSETIERLRAELKLLRTVLREARRILESRAPPQVKVEKLKQLFEGSKSPEEVQVVAHEESAPTVEGEA